MPKIDSLQALFGKKEVGNFQGNSSH